MKYRITSILAATCLLAPIAVAQDGWTGEGAFSAGYTTGNTETADLGLSLKLNRKSGLWTYSGEAAADYGETDSVETKNRYFLAGEIDRQIGDKLFAFGRTSYEKDEFSGFDSRLFVGGGLGYLILEGEPTSWSVQGGPGIKIDEVRETTTLVNGVPVTTPASTEQSFAVVGKSEFAHAFNEAVSLTNTTDFIYAQESTQIGNVLALTATLTDKFSARFSIDVRHDTNPPPGFEATDTATRISLVYGFGG
jgi:putative salt-induced outer membrane protein